MGDTHGLLGTHVLFFDIQTTNSMTMLEVLKHPNDSVCCHLYNSVSPTISSLFFFPLFSLLSLRFMLVVQKFKIVFLFIDNSTLILIFFLISNFSYWLFCQKKFLISNHDLLIFFKLDSHSFYFDFFFWILLWFLFFFSVFPFNFRFYDVLSYFFLFQVWSYFESFCIIFFSISSINIWFFEDWTLRFF
jgi:hypothetical protein